MNKYVYTLLIVSVVGGLINNLVSSFGNIKRYINYFLGVLMIICMLSPIIEFVGSGLKFKNGVEEFWNSIFINEAISNSNEIIINNGIDAIQKGIKNDIINKFSFNERDVIVELEVDESNIEAIKIRKINITLTGKASWSDADKVKEYLNNLIGGEISVVKR